MQPKAEQFGASWQLRDEDLKDLPRRVEKFLEDVARAGYVPIEQPKLATSDHIPGITVAYISVHAVKNQGYSDLLTKGNGTPQ